MRSSHCGSTGNNKDGCFLCGKSELGIMFGVSRDSTTFIKATLKLIYYIKRFRSEKTLQKTAGINIRNCSKNVHTKCEYINRRDIKAVIHFIAITLTKQVIQTVEICNSKSRSTSVFDMVLLQPLLLPFYLQPYIHY